MRHNVIIGKLYDGHLEFMQRIIVCFRPPPKISQSFNMILSPCAKYRGYIQKCTHLWNNPWTKSDDFLKFWVGVYYWPVLAFFRQLWKRYPSLYIRYNHDNLEMISFHLLPLIKVTRNLFLSTFWKITRILVVVHVTICRTLYENTAPDNSLIVLR